MEGATQNARAVVPLALTVLLSSVSLSRRSGSNFSGDRSGTAWQRPVWCVYPNKAPGGSAKIRVSPLQLPSSKLPNPWAWRCPAGMVYGEIP